MFVNRPAPSKCKICSGDIINTIKQYSSFLHRDTTISICSNKHMTEQMVSTVFVEVCPFCESDIDHIISVDDGRYCQIRKCKNTDSNHYWYICETCDEVIKSEGTLDNMTCTICESLTDVPNHKKIK